LQDIITEGWQTLTQDNLTFNPQFAVYRNISIPANFHRTRFWGEDKITRVKDLGLELNGNHLALMITIRETKSGMKILAQINPIGEQKILPPNLRLIIADDQDNIFKEVVSRANDKFIRYEFGGTKGDRFKIKVALEQASITEEFTI
jgi:hypothetical protein